MQNYLPLVLALLASTYSYANLRLCPGLDLVKTCGNLTCEENKGETETNCPADCKKNVTVRSYNNLTLCSDYTETQVPHTIEQAQDIVRQAIHLGKKVRPIGASHSATEILCSQGLVLPMEKLNKVIGLKNFHGKQVVEAQAGITVYALSEWLHKRGLALSGLPHMGFRDVTIGGAIATSSHGSSLKHSAVISNLIEKIEFIDGLGEIQTRDRYSGNKKEFQALTTHLGLLGVITKISFPVQRQFNLKVNVSLHPQKKMVEEGLINQVKDCDYGQINWFPGSEKFALTCGKKTDEKAHIGAHNKLLDPPVPGFFVKPVKQLLQQASCDNRLMCALEKARVLQFKYQPPFVKKNKFDLEVSANNVVGPSHRMVSSHITDQQKGFFQMDWEIAVPGTKAQEALHALIEHTKKNETCLPLVGVFIRFAQSQAASLMAYTHADQNSWQESGPVVFFEMPVYIPVGFNEAEFSAYEKQYQEFVTMLIKKFDGRPHWGKNKEWTIDLGLKQGAFQKNINQFYSVMKKLDPNGVFENYFAPKIFNNLTVE